MVQKYRTLKFNIWNFMEKDDVEENILNHDERSDKWLSLKSCKCLNITSRGTITAKVKFKVAKEKQVRGGVEK